MRKGVKTKTFRNCGFLFKSGSITAIPPYSYTTPGKTSGVFIPDIFCCKRSY